MSERPYKPCCSAGTRHLDEGLKVCLNYLSARSGNKAGGGSHPPEFLKTQPALSLFACSLDTAGSHFYSWTTFLIRISGCSYSGPTRHAGGVSGLSPPEPPRAERNKNSLESLRG